MWWLVPPKWKRLSLEEFVVNFKLEKTLILWVQWHMMETILDVKRKEELNLTIENIF